MAIPQFPELDYSILEGKDLFIKSQSMRPLPGVWKISQKKQEVKEKQSFIHFLREE
jgi:hypothetical protein